MNQNEMWILYSSSSSWLDSVARIYDWNHQSGFSRVRESSSYRRPNGVMLSALLRYD
jgi:hypothetical protein